MFLLILRSNLDEGIVRSRMNKNRGLLCYFVRFLFSGRFLVKGSYACFEFALELEVFIIPSLQYSWRSVFLLIINLFWRQIWNKDSVLLIFLTVVKKSSFAICFWDCFWGRLIDNFLLLTTSISIASKPWSPWIMRLLKSIEGKLSSIWRFFFIHVIFKEDILLLKWWRFQKFISPFHFFVHSKVLWVPSVFNILRTNLSFGFSRSIWTCPCVF